VTILRCEYAAVARHQRSQEIPKRFTVPPPHLIWEALDVRLFSPETELRQPGDDWAPRTVEIRCKAFSYLEVAHTRPGSDEVRYAPLRNVAAWEVRRNDGFEVVDDDRIDIGERGRPTR